MPTLTAQPRLQDASVALTVDNVLGLRQILRADANGTRPVRLRADALAGEGPRTFIDYEASLAQPALYRLVHSQGRAEAWADLTSIQEPRFLLPSIPQFSVAVDSITGYTSERESTARFHEVIGRSSPLVAEGRMGTRTGDLVAVFHSHDGAASLENMLRRGQTALLRQREHPGLDMYFNAPRVRVEADPDSGTWQVRVSFKELAFPPGNVLSRPDWDFLALAKAYPNFDDVAQEFGTFHDLTIGEAQG